MDVLAALREKLPLEPVPGLDDTWEGTGGPRVRILYLPHPGERVLFQVNVARRTDEADVRRFVSFARGHLDELFTAPPMIAVGGLRLATYGFDSAVAVLPAAADLTPSGDPAIDRRVYGLFPGWECEVSMTESEDLARRRIRRDIRYSDWERRPSPLLRYSFAFTQQGRPEVVRDEGFPGDASQVESILRFIAGGRSGRVECENHRGRTIHIEYDWGTDFTWESDPPHTGCDLDRVSELLWSFATGKDD
ncbi:hypothetical protein LX16_1991 [Stackebrandtia albiflava]|uniref:Uncharacterized protein n=1 Tax=Stackebrandtia albiflava TaxID=406432 RepID=A0A562VEK2_9ACTN|nr:hypothetical protein [Stackebrandtia albiflava]TWJ16264.1 hypothetical protein LX16_1991 [Stackebrandtia albiflava]